MAVSALATDSYAVKKKKIHRMSHSSYFSNSYNHQFNVLLSHIRKLFNNLIIRYEKIKTYALTAV